MQRRVMQRFAALFLAGALVQVASAEVSVERTVNGVQGLHFEPSEKGPWSPVREGVPLHDLLNPQGDGRADGWPATALNRNGQPFVAFASAGLDSEVFVSKHDGTQWLPLTNLSRQTAADHGPALTIDAWGNAFVAWNSTRMNRASVSFAGVRRDGQATTGVVELSSKQQLSRMPSLGVHGDGDVYVAYEERPGGPEDIPHLVIDRIRPVRLGDMTLHCSGENLPDFSRSISHPTRLTAPVVLAEAEVHVEQGHLWVTWIDSMMHVGWVELTAPGSFTAPGFVTLTPELGVKEAKEAIRQAVLAN